MSHACPAMWHLYRVHIVSVAYPVVVELDPVWCVFVREGPHTLGSKFAAYVDVSHVSSCQARQGGGFVSLHHALASACGCDTLASVSAAAALGGPTHSACYLTWRPVLAHCMSHREACAYRPAVFHLVVNLCHGLAGCTCCTPPHSMALITNVCALPMPQACCIP